MSRSFLLIGVVAVVWAIGITLADKTPSQGEQDSKLLTLYEIIMLYMHVPFRYRLDIAILR